MINKKQQEKLNKLSIKKRQEWNENFNIEFSFIEYFKTISLLFLVIIILLLSLGVNIQHGAEYPKILELIIAVFSFLYFISYIFIFMILLDISYFLYVKYQEYKWWKRIEENV